VLTGSSFTSANTNSAVEYDVSATAIAGGAPTPQVMFSSYISNNNDIGSYVPLTGENVLLTTNLAGETDILVLAYAETTGTNPMFGSLQWIEFI
jgi:hypothetical protein